MEPPPGELIMEDEAGIVFDPAGWEFQHFEGRNWEEFLPEPRHQLTDVVPEGWGTCAIHAYGDALTGRMRHRYGGANAAAFQVNLRQFIEVCKRHGILTEEGSSEVDIGRLARYFGVPVEGYLPIPAVRAPEFEGRTPYALGTTVASFRATPLPLYADGQLRAALAYREQLCAHLDDGPVVAGFRLQQHYTDQRPLDQPYRHYNDMPYLKEELSSGKVIQSSHSVVVYAYECPGGDVRSLKLHYQDNMKDAPHPRHLIHPDSIDEYHAPVIDGLTFSPEPKQSQDLLNPVPPPPGPYNHQQISMWDVVRDFFFS